MAFGYSEHVGGAGGDASASASAITAGRIRELRQQRHLSVRDFAARLQVSAATVSAIENGRTAVTVERLARMAEVLAVRSADLLRGEAVPTSRALEAAGARGPVQEPPDKWREFPVLDIDPVMASAIRCFVMTGYHGANMRAIAAGAGLSVAGVYHHYESKQVLLVRILDLTMDEIDWRLAAARDSVADGPGAAGARLAVLVEALALFHTLRPDLAFIGSTEMRSLAPLDLERISRRRSGTQRLLDVEVEAAVAAGSAHTRRPREDARAIATMCTALPQWFDNTGPTSPLEIAKEYAALALRMVGISTDTSPHRDRRHVPK